MKMAPWEKPSARLAPIAGLFSFWHCHPAAPASARSRVSTATARIPLDPTLFGGCLRRNYNGPSEANRVANAGADCSRSRWDQFFERLG